MILPVKDNGVRPAGAPNLCFYCGNAIQKEHKADCVCRQRTVVVELTLTYVISVPASWTEDDILFHRNDSSFCMNNDLTALAEWANEGNNCTCMMSAVKFLREATEYDMESLPSAVGKEDL